ncbi:hypothetical protein [Nocardioides sp. zg-1228]|uniref:hypothetical protein n=1 Tax=Nocardioides sp. zg-1228 TaxID=2763008 RepID=UPI0016433582|nr:hypothetical protein [Nocardioides sp. zg-1228]MBC2932935.1 hypothetical protein [Nocardioides sp. zg-1228]QSF56864.1 hypothetical protein JX575_14860 [Nocardioides sp. zg-1228]
MTSGINETGRTHAWLEQDDVIIDITAYQFDDIDEPIIVTTDRTWHEQSWRPMGGSLVASVDLYTEPGHRELALSDYAELRARALAILAVTG